ncbi:MAG: hypothetical protein ACREL5_02695 [Gemmatimonadales bacterium]
MRALWLAGLLCGSLAGAAGGQSNVALRAGLAERVPVATHWPLRIVADSGAHKTYWLAGFIAGGAVGLVGGLQLQHEINAGSDSRDPSFGAQIWFLVPTVLLALVGG